LSDPELEVLDPDPGQSPKLDGNMHKNHQKMDKFCNFNHYKIQIASILRKLCFEMLLKDLKIMVLEKK
jgi:hypothetical protein